MAITTTRNNDGINLAINNGDLQAIEEVIEKYHFKDEESLFRFALAALLRSETNGVYIEENNNKIFVQPSEKLLQPREEGQQSTNQVEPPDDSK